VIRHEVRPGDSLAGLRLRKLQTDGRRIVRFQRSSEAILPDFYSWDPDTVLRPGDTVVWIESRPIQPSDSPDGRSDRNGWRNAVQFAGSVLGKLRRGEALALGRRLVERVHRLVFLCGVALLAFLLAGGLLFYRFGPDRPFVDAVFATAGLLLGGYSDLLGGDFRFTQPFPWWMRLFGLGLTVVGTVFVGVLYALMTQSLISARLRFFRKAALPEAGHVIVIGMGNFGRRVVRRLRESGERVAAVSLADDPAASPHPEVPHLAGPRGHLEETLAAARVSTAQSVIAVTRDEMENLEMALMVRRLNPGAALSIRTYHPRFSENMARLFPRAKVLCVSALAAEAFVAAAFGEKVAQLFRLDDRTIIVTEYHIEADDTLHDLLISEVAYGYRVVPVLHIQPDREAAHWMPSEDFRLAVGDRLFVLATMDGLRRIERGIMFHRQFAVWIPALAPSLVSVDPFEIANIIARISGCDIGEARELMDRLPAELPRPLYRHQALAIVESLRKNRVEAKVVRLSP
jgi:Trk K+ transport system NAD-binding subunit